jgi:catechol 2,3-dioxygenase-like lactoylglutathione lyase family enzyme
MPGKLLTLTFHQPGALTGEDLRFKENAIDSGLVSGDAMEEVGQNNDGPKPFFDANKDLLLPSTTSPAFGGLQIAKRGNVSLVSMLNVSEKTWSRPGYTSKPDPQNPGNHFPSVFEDWLLKVFAVPAEVLVLAGHHSVGVVWGAETAGHKRVFCALVPMIRNGVPMVQIRGHKANETEATGLAGPFELTDSLKACRLLVVLGCNGATDHIKPWRDCIKKATGGRAPFILGWRGVHSFPRDRKNQFFSPDFWGDLADLAPGAVGNKNLDFLHDGGFRDRIIKVWVEAMKKNFTPTEPKDEDQSHLFFAGGNDRGPRGCGAIDPDGNVFWVVDKNGTVQQKGQLT